ncbi:3-deoxy-manno-octulosonate cytidylyltransferase, partial [bacterium]|nr:3-deoxy-manno-octulosonate cytidylyltransferase [bacterium]
FPKKVIAPLLGKPLVQYIWEAAAKAKSLSAVWVAVDDPEVVRVVEAFGGKAVMTPSELPSGSDRVAYLAKDCEAEIVVNLQADEPLLPAYAIDKLVELLKNRPEFDIATLVVRKNTPSLLEDPNVVKCVSSANQRALYFSRKPLGSSPDGSFLKHLGIYAYRKQTLLKLAGISPSPLELTEKLEQLRALENGFSIGVCLVSEDTLAVDVPSDLEKVERVLREKPGVVI